MFHAECITPWFEDHHICPNCRDDVRERIENVN